MNNLSFVRHVKFILWLIIFLMGSWDCDRTMRYRQLAIAFLLPVLILAATLTHSTFTIDGSKTIVDGVYPTNHAEHETVETTHGFNDWLECGLEYYGSVGPVTGFDAISQQQHQIFPAIDLNIAPQWEINFGRGVGVTGATDHGAEILARPAAISAA